jgi:hypothetical protein
MERIYPISEIKTLSQWNISSYLYTKIVILYFVKVNWKVFDEFDPYLKFLKTANILGA